MKSRAATTAIIAAALASCGEPLVTQDYRGEPLWTYEINVQRGGSIPRGTAYQLALFFQPNENEVNPERMVELPGSSIRAEVPSVVSLNMFEPMREEHMIRGNGGANLGYGVARVFAYTDTNGDGRRQAGEPFTSQIGPTAFIVLPTDRAAGTTIAKSALSAGVHPVHMPQPCSFVPPPPTNPGNCGVPLGDPCGDDKECGGGVCLKETKLPWPAGYCAIVDPPPNGCRPGAAAYMHAPTYAPTAPGVSGYYGRACTVDADCTRTKPREQIYACDVGLQMCLPRTSSLLPSGAQLEVEPLCAGMRRPAPMPQ